jgi:PIN domain nuclease of toxin-antitoxin system
MRTGNRSSPTPLLIDTHYWIWIQAGIRERLTEQSLDVIRIAASEGNLFLSLISVWELGLLESKGRVHLHTSCARWVEEALAMPGLSVAPLTPAIAIESTRLPGSFHADPADRIIVATARALGARLLTSDKNIRAYGRQRHVLLA